MNTLAATIAEVKPAAIDLMDQLDAQWLAHLAQEDEDRHWDEMAEAAAEEAAYLAACEMGHGAW